MNACVSANVSAIVGVTAGVSVSLLCVINSKTANVTLLTMSRFDKAKNSYFFFIYNFLILYI